MVAGDPSFPYHETKAGFFNDLNMPGLNQSDSTSGAHQLELTLRLAWQARPPPHGVLAGKNPVTPN